MVFTVRVQCTQVSYCILSLVLINLCRRRALWALTATVMRVCLVWGLCGTNADGLYGCRSGLALSHTAGNNREIKENFGRSGNAVL